MIGWGVGIAALAGITIAFWPFVAEDQEQLEQLMQGLPEAMLAAFGMAGQDLFSPAGFLDSQLFAFFSPLVLLIFAIGGTASTIAGEEQDGRLEILLSNPVSRRRIVVGKAVGIGVLLVGLTAVHLVTIAVLARVVDLDVGIGRLVEMHLSLLLLAAAFGGLALAAAGLTGRRGATIGVSATVGFATYLLDSFAPIVGWLEPLRPASPFYLYRGADPLRHGLDPVHAGSLAALAVVLTVVAAWAFERRDIGVA
jgi:ABC-2 type transport system permease protein